jgi:hypothetical protein
VAPCFIPRFCVAAHTVVPADDLRASVRGNIEYVLRSLREDEYADVAAARRTGALRAEQGGPLAVVMVAFRILLSQIWHSLVRQARAHELVSNQALVDAASDHWSARDKFAFVVVAAEALQLAQKALPGIENRLRACHIGSAWRLTPDAQIGIVRFENAAGIRTLTTTLTAAAASRIGISPPYLTLTDTAAALRFAPPRPRPPHGRLV